MMHGYAIYFTGSSRVPEKKSEIKTFFWVLGPTEKVQLVQVRSWFLFLGGFKATKVSFERHQRHLYFPRGGRGLLI